MIKRKYVFRQNILFDLVFFSNLLVQCTNILKKYVFFEICTNINILFIFKRYNGYINIFAGDVMAKRANDDNKLKILQLINIHGATSRVDIAKMLGFTKSAITIVTNEMINEKLIYEKNIEVNKSQKSIRGRKKILLDINENYKLVLGVVLEKDRLTVGITNLFGQTVAVSSAQISKGENIDIAAKTHQIASEIMAVNWIESDSILGVGVAITLDACEHFGKDMSMSKCCDTLNKALCRYFEYPVFVMHFTYTMALAQKMYKILSPDSIQSYVMIRNSHEIESKIVLDGKISDRDGENLDWFSKLSDIKKIDNEEKFFQTILTIKTMLNPKKIFISTDINSDKIKRVLDDETVELFTKNFEEKFYANFLVPKDSIKTSLHVFASSLVVYESFYEYRNFENFT